MDTKQIAKLVNTADKNANTFGEALDMFYNEKGLAPNYVERLVEFFYDENSGYNFIDIMNKNGVSTEDSKSYVIAKITERYEKELSDINKVEDKSKNNTEDLPF